MTADGTSTGTDARHPTPVTVARGGGSGENRTPFTTAHAANVDLAVSQAFRKVVGFDPLADTARKPMQVVKDRPDRPNDPVSYSVKQTLLLDALRRSRAPMEQDDLVRAVWGDHPPAYPNSCLSALKAEINRKRGPGKCIALVNGNPKYGVRFQWELRGEP